MNHSLAAEGLGIRVRPVRMEDAEFLVWLRNMEHAKGKLGDSAKEVAEEEKWLQAYFLREGDFYFIAETICGIRVAAFGIYNLTGDSAEVGRWVNRPDSPTVVPSIIPGLDIAFGQLRLRELRTKVVSTNERVLKLDRQVGFREERLERNAQIIGGIPVDFIHMTMKSGDWAVIRDRILSMAQFLENKVRKWEQKILFAADSASNRNQ